MYESTEHSGEVKCGRNIEGRQLATGYQYNVVVVIAIIIIKKLFFFAPLKD